MKTFKQFSEELTNEGFLKAAAITAAMLPVAGAIAKKFLKPKSDKKIDDARKDLPIGGDYRSGNTSDFESGVNAIKQKKEDKKTGKTRVFGDPTGQYSDFFK